MDGQGAHQNQFLGGGDAPEMRREGGALPYPAPPSCARFFRLPAPPSANRMFKNNYGKTGRVRSDTEAYRDWKSQVDWMLRHQGGIRTPPLFDGYVIVLIGVERSNALADIDNLTKALLDALVRAGVIKDDSLVLGVATAWNPPGKRQATLGVMPAQNLSIEFHLAPDRRHGGWFLSTPFNEGEADHGD